MGERVVQLPRDPQPLLVGAAPRGLLPGPLGLLRTPLGLPQRLTRGARRDQPGQLEGAAGARERLARVVQARGEGRERERGEHGDAHRDRDGAVPGPHRGVDREQVRDGGNVEARGLIARRAQPGDDKHGDRRPAARGERQPAGRQEQVAEQAGAGGGVAAGHPGEQQRRGHADGDRPVDRDGPA